MRLAIRGGQRPRGDYPEREVLGAEPRDASTTIAVLAGAAAAAALVAAAMWARARRRSRD
jgi:hypothetical protein